MLEPMANSSMLTLPSMAVPSLPEIGGHRRFIGRLEAFEDESRRGLDAFGAEQVDRWGGHPPSFRPLARRWSEASAIASALSGVSTMKALRSRCAAILALCAAATPFLRQEGFRRGRTGASAMVRMREVAHHSTTFGTVEAVGGFRRVGGNFLGSPLVRVPGRRGARQIAPARRTSGSTPVVSTSFNCSIQVAIPFGSLTRRGLGFRHPDPGEGWILATVGIE